MSECYRGVAFWNKNHSHPEYEEGWTKGDLYLHEDGIKFLFNESRRSPLVIAWKNVQSTYPSLIPYPNGFTQFAYYITGSFLITALTLGELDMTLGSVSIKYKEAAYDKIIVSEFLGFGTRSQKQRWSNEVDAKIWEYKRQDRGIVYER